MLETLCRTAVPGVDRHSDRALLRLLQYRAGIEKVILLVRHSPLGYPQLMHPQLRRNFVVFSVLDEACWLDEAAVMRTHLILFVACPPTRTGVLLSSLHLVCCLEGGHDFGEHLRRHHEVRRDRHGGHQRRQVDRHEEAHRHPPAGHQRGAGQRPHRQLVGAAPFVVVVVNLSSHGYLHAESLLRSGF